MTVYKSMDRLTDRRMSWCHACLTFTAEFWFQPTYLHSDFSVGARIQKQVKTVVSILIRFPVDFFQQF